MLIALPDQRSEKFSPNPKSRMPVRELARIFTE